MALGAVVKPVLNEEEKVIAALEAEACLPIYLHCANLIPCVEAVHFFISLAAAI